MGALFDRLKEFYEHKGWPSSQVPGETILSMTYRGRHGQWVFATVLHESIAVLTVFSRAPLACPPERMPAMCELIVRMNFGMTHGCFDMDHADGEIRFRTGVDLAGLEMSDEMLETLAGYNLASMDTWLPAIRAVVDGAEPEKAVADLEASF